MYARYLNRLANTRGQNGGGLSAQRRDRCGDSRESSMRQPTRRGFVGWTIAPLSRVGAALSARSVALVAGAFALMLVLAAPVSAARHDTRVAADDGSGEPEIAVNPLDPSNLVVAHMHGVSFSEDGGRTWHAASFPGSGGDPAVVADGSGRFY